MLSEKWAFATAPFTIDSAAYQLVEKVEANTGVYTMEQLVHEIGVTLTDQNKTDIAASLERKGMDADMARKHADILEYIVEGGELSDVQMKMVEKNEFLEKSQLNISSPVWSSTKLAFLCYRRM